MNYVPVLLIGYLGLLAGCIISNYTKEELLPGKKYFIFIKSIIFSAVIFFFLLYLGQLLYVASILSLVVLGMAYLWATRFSYFDLFSYSIFPLALYEMQNYLPHAAILIFLYGIAAASVSTRIEKGFFWNAFHNMADNSIYLLVGLGLYLLNI